MWGGFMAKEFAKSFYNSKAWQRTRDAYKKYRGGLCERCLKEGLYVPGVIVHHKIHLTPGMMNNPDFTLNWDNLELLCKDCHALEHEDEIKNSNWIVNVKKKKAEARRRYYVDDNGNVCIK